MHHDVDPFAFVAPVGTQYALRSEAQPCGQVQSRAVLLGDEGLDPAESEVGEAPVDQQSECLGGDPPPARVGDDAAAHFAYEVVTHDEHDLAEIPIVGEVGDHQVEHVAVRPVLLELGHDTGRVVGWQRRYPAGGVRILAERHRGAKVGVPEGAQGKGRAVQRRSGEVEAHGDKSRVART